MNRPLACCGARRSADGRRQATRGVRTIASRLTREMLLPETLLSNSLDDERAFVVQIATYQSLSCAGEGPLMRAARDGGFGGSRLAQLTIHRPRFHGPIRRFGGIRARRDVEESSRTCLERSVVKPFLYRSPAGCTTQSLSLTHKSMAWRPYENLIDGELDNRVPGKVMGWIRFLRRGQTPLQVELDLKGDFHEDIQGKAIRISNPNPTDRHQLLEREGSYVEGIRPTQCGVVGDITGGFSLGVWSEELLERLWANEDRRRILRGSSDVEREQMRQAFVAGSRKRIERGEICYCHCDYPYIEWHDERNGRVVLELECSQLVLIGEATPKRPRGRRDSFEMEMIESPSFLSFVELVATKLFRRK